LHIIGELVEIGMEASKKKSGYVLWTRFNNIIIIGVLNRNCAVDVGAVGEVLNFNGGMMNTLCCSKKFLTFRISSPDKYRQVLLGFQMGVYRLMLEKYKIYR
jgi:hypothetical protein